jgi:hypothetical protein
MHTADSRTGLKLRGFRTSLDACQVARAHFAYDLVKRASGVSFQKYLQSAITKSQEGLVGLVRH